MIVRFIQVTSIITAVPYQLMATHIKPTRSLFFFSFLIQILIQIMSEITNGDESLSSTTVDLDDTVEVKKVNRPDLVEINDAFDDLEINPILKSIAGTNELTITWQELQKILDLLVKKVLKYKGISGPYWMYN